MRAPDPAHAACFHLDRRWVDPIIMQQLADAPHRRRHNSPSPHRFRPWSSPRTAAIDLASLLSGVALSRSLHCCSAHHASTLASSAYVMWHLPPVALITAVRRLLPTPSGVSSQARAASACGPWAMAASTRWRFHLRRPSSRSLRSSGPRKSEPRAPFRSLARLLVLLLVL